MTGLTWWYRITGAIYIVLGLSWLPTLSALSLEQKIPNFDGAAGGTAYNGFFDWMLVFSLDMLVIGVALIIGSRRPKAFIPVLWIVIALELVRGIGQDIYMIAHGYSIVSNLAFIALHVAIIVTGLLAWRAARRSTPVS